MFILGASYSAESDKCNTTCRQTTLHHHQVRKAMQYYSNELSNPNRDRNGRETDLTHNSDLQQTIEDQKREIERLREGKRLSAERNGMASGSTQLSLLRGSEERISDLREIVGRRMSNLERDYGCQLAEHLAHREEAKENNTLLKDQLARVERRILCADQRNQRRDRFSESSACS